MTPLELFATGLVVISAGVLGLSMILTTARTASQARRRSALRQVVQARGDEIEAIQGRVANVERIVQGRQGECGELETRRARTDAAARAVAADKVELVHELGAAQPGHTLFRCELRTAPEFARLDNRRVIFAREIWERRNVAHVWAADAEAAMTTLLRAFPPASGILPGGLQPETAQAQPPAPAPAAPAPPAPPPAGDR